MSTIDASPSSNGRGSEAWSRSWTHVRVDRRSLGYCRVTFDHPPINTITATTVAELAELVGLIELDPDLNVVVFDSANPGFYLADYDVEHEPSTTAALPAGPSGMHAWLDLLVRLSRAPVVSIASIRGRARGAGSEFVLACDLRFASREKTLLGQFEVGPDVVAPGRSDGATPPIGQSRPGARDPPRRRRRRRTARGAVRIRQPRDCRRPARHRGRSDRLTPGTVRSRGDRAHEVILDQVTLPPSSSGGAVLTFEFRPGSVASRSWAVGRRARDGSGSRAWRTPCAGATRPCVD